MVHAGGYEKIWRYFLRRSSKISRATVRVLKLVVVAKLDKERLNFRRVFTPSEV